MLLTQLDKAAGLRAISRTSVMAYAVHAKPVKEIEGPAMILSQIGDVAGALEELDRLEPGPSWMRAQTLDPRWAPIRADPRFRALLLKYVTP